MKSAKKIVSVFLSVMMVVTCISVSFTVNASTGNLCSKYYATNPQNKVGIKKTITIDGDASDWSEDMLIAQGAAWDVANHYKGGHENCVLDTYALFATWDNNNLYVGWQMVNTTDTWARSGDGPLSDGGRVLDVPLILALSVDPTSTSMSNKNTNGGPIWGQKMGLSFDTHVDHLLYMSGKPGLGEPAMFTAVDENGNTDYKAGCHTFKSTGIEYKMAETNICSSIYGLNYSEDPNDVYNEDADWCDYKTFKGSAGTHNTKYDSFYEIKIPLSSLGIDASYVEKYGIGAMLVATRGESGLDCIPFDDTMLDNALGSYSNDPSTSKEKDDEDVITSKFARIGNIGGDIPDTRPVPQPTTQVTTTKPAPTTAPATTKPIGVQPITKPVPVSNLTVTATSNIFPKKTATVSQSAKTVTVSYDMKSAMKLVNGQLALTYDSSVLKFDPAKNRDIMPYIFNETTNQKNNVIMAAFSDVVNLYDFTSSKNFVNVTFDIISGGNTTVDLRVEELSVGYHSNNILNYKNAVVNSSVIDLSQVPGFTGSSISGTTSIVSDQVATTVKPTVEPTTPIPTTQPTTAPVSDKLNVKASSNFFPTASKVYDKNTNQLTVTYKLGSNFNVIDSQWILNYDASKLSYSSSNTAKTVMPNVSNPIINRTKTGQVKGTVSNASLFDFNDEKEFVTVVFDVIGTGTANIDLNIEYLGFAYYDNNGNIHRAYVVDNGLVKNIKEISGFGTAKYTVDTVFDYQDSDTLNVNASSNFFKSASKTLDKDAKTVTIAYKLQSSMSLINSEWVINYDPSKLAFDPAKNKDAAGKRVSLMPRIANDYLNTDKEGKLIGSFTNINLYDFTTEDDFIKVTFDVIGTGSTTVDLNVQFLGIGYYKSSSELNEDYLVEYGKVKDLSSTPVFKDVTYNTNTVFDPDDIILYGDVNGDGRVNILDATLIQKHIAELEKLNEKQMKIADVNHDGNVNILDVTEIQKIAAELI